MAMRTRYESVSEFISQFPPKTAEKLKKIRSTIKKAAPAAKEIISYGMPAYKLNHDLVYFSAFKGHIGFFPTSSGVRAFKKELKGYSVSPGTIRFPLDRPVPYGLIGRITKFRAKEDKGK